MAEVSIKCPNYGMDLRAPHEDELAKTFKGHPHEHGMEMSEEGAKKKVKMMVES